GWGVPPPPGGGRHAGRRAGSRFRGRRQARGRRPRVGRAGVVAGGAGGAGWQGLPAARGRLDRDFGRLRGAGAGAGAARPLGALPDGRRRQPRGVGDGFGGAAGLSCNPVPKTVYKHLFAKERTFATLATPLAGNHKTPKGPLTQMATQNGSKAKTQAKRATTETKKTPKNPLCPTKRARTRPPPAEKNQVVAAAETAVDFPVGVV